MTNETREILKAIKKEIDAEIEQCQHGIDNFKGDDIYAALFREQARAQITGLEVAISILNRYYLTK